MDALPSATQKLEAHTHLPTFVDGDTQKSSDQKSFAILQNLLLATQLAISSQIPCNILLEVSLTYI